MLTAEVVRRRKTDDQTLILFDVLSNMERLNANQVQLVVACHTEHVFLPIGSKRIKRNIHFVIISV